MKKYYAHEPPVRNAPKPIVRHIIWAFAYIGSIAETTAGFRECNINCIGISISRSEAHTLGLNAALQYAQYDDNYIPENGSYAPRAWYLERVR